MNGQPPQYPGQPPMVPGQVPIPGQMFPPAQVVPAQVAPIDMPVAAPMPMGMSGPGQLPGFQLYEPDMAEIQALADKIVAEGSRSKGPSDFYFFKEGDNYIRVLPPWSAARKWVRFIGKHFNLLGTQTSICYESTHPGKGYICPIDKVLAVFRQFLGDKEIKGMERKGYNFCNALVYDYDQATKQFVLQGGRAKPYVVQLAIFGVYEPMIQLMGRPPFHKIMDLQQGCIIDVKRPKDFQGKKNYTVQVMQVGPLAPEESAARMILSQMHNLDTFADFGPPSSEKLAAQVDLADDLATSLAAVCGTTRSQLAQWNLLPEKLYLEGAGAGAAPQVAMVPGGFAPPAMPGPMMAGPASMPAPSSPFPVSPVMAGPFPYPTAPVAPMAAPPVAAAPYMMPGPATMPMGPQMWVAPTAPPALPVQIQGSGSPLGASVITNVPTMVSPLPAGPAPIIPTPVRLGEVPSQVAPPVAVMPAVVPAPAPAAEGGQVFCPVCRGGPFAGVRGLKLHLAKSTCGTQAAAPPAAPPAVAPVATMAAPTPAVPGGVPACFSNYGTQMWCPTCPYQAACAGAGA